MTLRAGRVGKLLEHELQFSRVRVDRLLADRELFPRIRSPGAHPQSFPVLASNWAVYRPIGRQKLNMVGITLADACETVSRLSSHQFVRTPSSGVTQIRRNDCGVLPVSGRTPQSTTATRAISRILSSYSHLSGPAIAERAHAAYLERNGRAALFLLGLAPGGVYRADVVSHIAGGLLHHRFTLACAHRPQIRERTRRVRAIGGLLSVALSVGLPRLGVTQHHCPAESGLSSAIARRDCPPALQQQG